MTAEIDDEFTSGHIHEDTGGEDFHKVVGGDIDGGSALEGSDCFRSVRLIGELDRNLPRLKGGAGKPQPAYQQK